jgi:hypothetical protein
MIRGTTKEIALNPKEYTNLEDEELFIPYQMELRNGQLTDAGNWRKRPGYDQKIDTTSNYSINALLDVGPGYAIDSNGAIYSLDLVAESAVQLQNISLGGSSRPQYDEHNDLIIIVAGGYPVKIENNQSALLGGSPGFGAKFIGRVSTYTILAGYDPTEFKWSGAGNPEEWDSSDFENIQQIGNTIKHMLTRREYIYFFTEKHIEVWVHIGRSDTVFARRDNLWVDSGVGDASYSPVIANDNIYFFDSEDRSFNILNGPVAEVISRSHRKSLESLTVTNDCYGLDCRKENCIRWFFPTNGECFKYDYLHKTFSRDNKWLGGWQRLPMNSYMEVGGTAYFGDYEPTGLVYELSRDKQDDNGTAIRVFRDFALKLSDRGHRGRLNRVGFRVKRGVGDVGETPVFSYRYRFDRGEWFPWRDLDLGVQGDDDPWIYEYAFGMGNEVEFEIQHTSSHDFLLTSMEATIEELQH